ncbi:hypothetical protein PROFUN_05544 [Planoprotostelium fungivorum]|uniref:Uncharacterized protein n=1 Tax=Planoprotostelium fungivorum TaxID=1890364 RepID=A0A2P6N012_9EUKA|nr:hypothetical protein PROFUN_05544 [Planoprotostelium fungivorum]
MEIQRRHAEGKLSEYVWQFEFYRCAHAVLRGEHRVSSEYQIDKPVAVGEKHDRGSPPCLNFWINSTLKFGFELLVDGIGQGQHVSRFEEVEEEKITSWAVIDFLLEISATKKHIQCTFIERELLGFLWFEIILYKQRLIELFGSYVVTIHHTFKQQTQHIRLTVTQYAGQNNLLLHARVTPGKECKIIKMQ